MKLPAFGGGGKELCVSRSAPQLPEPWNLLPKAYLFGIGDDVDIGELAAWLLDMIEEVFPARLLTTMPA